MFCAPRRSIVIVTPAPRLVPHAPHARAAVPRTLASLLLLLLLPLFTACVTTGSTLNSGVGDEYLAHPPWYAGAREAPSTRIRIGHLPLVHERGGAESVMASPGGGVERALAPLVDEMNRYLDSLGVTVKLATAAARPRSAPDVMFGCVLDASGDCTTEGEDRGLMTVKQDSTMRLAVGRPSERWTAWMAEAAERGGVAHTLVLTLEAGHYLPRQRNVAGEKEVELGTGHTVALPWLTSLDTPVSVLQLTGARIAIDGLAIRIGAEGLLARRTRPLVSAMGAPELITEEDVTQLRAARRTDLPGEPLVWQVALRQLVEELTGERVR